MKKSMLITLVLFYLANTLSRGQGLACPDATFQRIDTEIVAMSLSADSRNFLRSLSGSARAIVCNPVQSFVAAEKSVLPLYCKLFFLLVLPTTPPADRERISRALDLIRALMIDLHRFAEAPAAEIPRSSESAPAPAGGCKVRILLRQNDFLGDPGARFFAENNQILNLQAQGDPAGGTFSWDADPPPGAGTASAGNRATFAGERRGETRIVVTYTAPDGSRCQDELRIIVR